MFDDLELVPNLITEAQDGRAVTQTAVLLAAERARLHVEEARRLAELAVTTAEEAQAHQKSADYWLDVAMCGARRLGAST